MPKYLDENGLSKHIAIEKQTFLKQSDAQEVQVLQIDNTPTANSNNLVKSGGVKTALDAKEATANKVTSLSAQSTDTQYPSAKCVYDLVGDIETLLAAI